MEFDDCSIDEIHLRTGHKERLFGAMGFVRKLFAFRLESDWCAFGLNFRKWEFVSVNGLL